jgi:fibronectin type III domain protein
MKIGHLPFAVFALLGLIGALTFLPAGSRPAVAHQISTNGPTSCLDVPVSPAIVQPTSCWVTGPTSIVVAGTGADARRDGEVVLVSEERKRAISLQGAGAVRITSIGNGTACMTTASGATVGVDIKTGRTGPTCAGRGDVSSRAMSTQATTITTAASAPQPSSSIYVYGSYVDACGESATTGCPLFNDGAAEAVPAAGGMTILDFGAPCFDPATLAWGTQLYISQSCTPDSELVILAQTWIRGYETNPNRSTSSPYIVVAGTSNSLTAAVPGYALGPQQMAAHGQAWFTSVVNPIAVASNGLAAPVAAWSGSDIEQSGGGDWYDGPTSRAWVDAYAAASGATKPCVPTRNGLMVDYGDYVPTAPGWVTGDLYHVAWGAAPACPVPEIYFTVNAAQWQSVNRWAQNARLPAMQFAGVLSEDGIGGSLSASGSWSALQNASGQAAPYLSVIGGINGATAEVPDPPAGVTAVAGAASATIAWSYPAWDGGARITSYNVTAWRGGAPVQTVSMGGWPVVADTTTFQGLSNGTAYRFTVSATNAVGAGPQSQLSSPVTPSERLPYTAVSYGQYHLTGSDGSTWFDVDGRTLSLTFRSSVSGDAVITANADLSTGTAGINQDLGIAVNGTVAAWTENGSPAAMSPNAVTVASVYPVTNGAVYTVKLQWKTNKPSPAATIFAGAGPIGGRFSPTRLTLQLVPTAANVASTAFTGQPALSNSNGSSWVSVDPQHLALTYRAPAAGTVIVTGNADLWTPTAGYNQDLGLAVNGSIAAWKESGGLAGGSSPSAVQVQAAIPVTAGAQYAIDMRWKTDRNAPGVTIYAGAAATTGQFSPTSLNIRFVAGGLDVAVSAGQYHLSGSDGSTWTAIDSTKLTLPATGGCVAIVSATADLWTSTAGVNPDLAIAVTPLDAIAYAGGIVGWQESGAAAGNSPKAAFIQSVVGLPAGHAYAISLLWKSSRPAGAATIYAGAGGGGAFSPTTLTAELTCS